LDQQSSSNQSKPLAHTHKTYSRARAPEGRVKTHASVHDPQANFIVCRTDLHMGLVRFTVFSYIAQRFLSDSKQAQRHSLRNFRGNSAVAKFDLDLEFRAQLFAKTRQSRHQAYKLKLAGMELV